MRVRRGARVRVVDARRDAVDATTARPDRPATAIVHDSDDARLVLFRVGPGQEVAPHTSASTVVLTVLSGAGFVFGGEPAREYPVHPGVVVTYAPRELHGMRAAADASEPFVLLATIAPRPGTAPQSPGRSPSAAPDV